jgi:hypothetical protein
MSMSFVVIIFLFVFVFGPLAKAAAARLSRESLPPPSHSPGEMAALREEVERLSREVTRLQDEQAFMVRLLGDGDRARLIEREQANG